MFMDIGVKVKGGNLMEYYTFQIISNREGIIKSRTGPLLYDTYELAEEGFKKAFDEGIEEYMSSCRYPRFSFVCEKDEYGIYICSLHGEVFARAAIYKLIKE